MGKGNRERGTGNSEEGVGSVVHNLSVKALRNAYEREPLLPTPHSPLPFLRPIDKDVFGNLGIPCIDVTTPDATKIIQGKPLTQIVKDVPVPTGENTAGVNSAGLNPAAALFSEDKFIAMIERQNNKWSYGYVYARD